MSYAYFPSCNFTAASPEAAERIKAFLEKRMPVVGCCRVDQTDYSEKTVVYFCQACREVLEEKGNRRQKAENLFVYLDRDTEFSWPDYSGLTVTVQDCWRDREHPEIFDAVRSCLRKMGIAVLEMEENRESSVFCGNLHFVPRNPENRELLARFPDTPLYKLPSEAEEQLMREQVEKHPCPLAVCYCNRCVKGVVTGGGKAVHLLELVTETWKE